MNRGKAVDQERNTVREGGERARAAFGTLATQPHQGASVISDLQFFYLRAFVVALLLCPQVFAETADPWAGFEAKVFEGETVYSAAPDAPVNGALHARSEGAASGLFRDQPVDLVATPWLCWQWRAVEHPDATDHRTRAGDDYAARVYVVDRRGLMGLTSISINYVWTGSPVTADHWPNPFTDRVIMVPLRSGVHGWTAESRNVRDDFQRLFGEDVAQIDAVAIMTDSDNSGTSAAAMYGPISFSAEPCHQGEDQ